jgi:transglutaminase-like putative cysteine protease
LACFLLVAAGALAQVSPAPAPSSSGPAVELVKDHVDLEINSDGSYEYVREVALRVLTEQGREGLQKMGFSYTEGFQSIDIHSAYTLKANGTRIDVAQSGMLHGRGASSAPGFEDLKTTTVVFPNLEIGDQVVVVTLFRQTTPWFPGQFAQDFPFTRQVRSDDVQISVTAPQDLAVHFDANALSGGAPETIGSKTRRTWSFHNDTPLRPEQEAVSDNDDGPHLVVSTFADYAAVAHVYAGMIDGKAAVTPAIQALADQVTAGVTDRREQTRLLYEWVSSHIGYVDIVLGAGGFVPHQASSVLETRYGDCKDHVMMLEALLAAKGIPSSVVLINAGNTYKLSSVASPFQFDHAITYVPEFKLYLDSTARIAPFGVLPFADSGKPVIQIAAGIQTETPVANSKTATMRSTEVVTVAADGSATGDSKVQATGVAAYEMRARIAAIESNSDGAYLRAMLGPGTDGTLDRGDTTRLASDYAYSAHYRMTNIATFPGPGALPAAIGYKPFEFSSLIAGSFPPSRMHAYACISVTAEENLTVNLPPGVQVLALPKSGLFSAPDMTLKVGYEDAGRGTIHENIKLVIDHPEATCTADYYNRARADLTKMMAAMRAQILYK